MRKLILILIAALACLQLFAASAAKQYIYAEKDSVKLSMDVYTPENMTDNMPCVIFVFGGGFKTGSKNWKTNVDFCKQLSDSGFMVAAIDYRLGMKKDNQKRASIKTLVNSIRLAEEDIYSATRYITDNAAKLQVDPSSIFLCGSSAGAVSALQADFDLSNNRKIAQTLPACFRYAGVVAFAGGVYSTEGTPGYKNQPSPTMFFHGTDDQIVRYDKVRFFNVGFFGTKALSKVYNRKGYPHAVLRFKNMGHDMSYLPMIYHVKEIVWFLKNAGNTNIKSVDAMIDGAKYPKMLRDDMQLRELYRKI